MLENSVLFYPHTDTTDPRQALPHGELALPFLLLRRGPGLPHVQLQCRSLGRCRCPFNLPPRNGPTETRRDCHSQAVLFSLGSHCKVVRKVSECHFLHARTHKRIPIGVMSLERLIPTISYVCAKIACPGVCSNGHAKNHDEWVVKRGRQKRPRVDVSFFDGPVNDPSQVIAPRNQ